MHPSCFCRVRKYLGSNFLKKCESESQIWSDFSSNLSDCNGSDPGRHSEFNLCPLRTRLSEREKDGGLWSPRSWGACGGWSWRQVSSGESTGWRRHTDLRQWRHDWTPTVFCLLESTGKAVTKTKGIWAQVADGSRALYVGLICPPLWTSLG